MIPREAQKLEVAANYEVFQAALPELLQHRRGSYVVYRHQQFVDFFDTFHDALAYCIDAYSDRLFSIQEITDEPLILGWLPDAATDGSLRPAERADR